MGGVEAQMTRSHACSAIRPHTSHTVALASEIREGIALDVKILRVYLTPHTFLPSDFLKTREPVGCDTLK